MGEKQHMIGKKALLGSVLVVMACLMISCTDNRGKNIYMSDGTHLRMKAADNFYIEFSQETNEIILYPNMEYEMRIPYAVIDDSAAEIYLDQISFCERYNEKRYSAFSEEGNNTYFYYCAPFESKATRSAEYTYWIYIEIQVENEDSFRRKMEITDDVAMNTLSGKLDLYEVDE